jgi:hypothetical protein
MKTNALFHVRTALATCILAFTGISARADSAAPVETATAISKVPYVITKAGTYIVKKNLAYSGTGNAITIQASDVTLDLGGHVLTSTAPQTDFNANRGISAGGAQDITVRNGVVRNFGVAVGLELANTKGRALVEDLVTENSGGNGIYINNGSSAVVRNCQVLDTGYESTTVGVTGIFVLADNAKVVGNVVGNILNLGANNSDGINVNAHRCGLVEKNTVSAVSNGRYGIICSNGSGSDAMVVENTVENFSYGIEFSSTGKYRANLTYNCPTPFSGGTAVGSENN